MLLHILTLTSLTIVSVSSTNLFQRLDTSPLLKRQQEYVPSTHQCGAGDTCEEACGAGYQWCGAPSALYCYNPGEGQPCCGADTASPWACDPGDYCLINGYCCPGGVDQSQCALNLGVTLPATFVASTSTTAGSVGAAATTTSPAVTTPTDLISSYTQSAASASVAVYTGAASADNVVGNAGVFYSILALVLNLF